MEKEKVIWLVLLSIFIFILDRVTKVYAIANLDYIKNKGIILGFSDSLFSIIFSFIALFLVALAIFLIKKSQIRIILTLIFVAGCSNFIDRIIYSGVIDFIRIGDFPYFNIADFVISCCIIFFMILILKNEFKTKIVSTK